MRFTARVLGFLFAFILIVFVSKTSFAQTNPNLQQYQTPNTNADVPKNLHFWTQNVMLEVMSTMICQLSGIDPINPSQDCLGIDTQSGKIGFVKNSGGAIGFTGKLIGKTFMIPVHISDYTTYAINNFGFPKKSYAQNTGIGYTGLQPVLGLFTIFRNIAYILMVFVFVLIGIAIMLRIKIDPRTVMTIQNQIPKLVIGVVMITFSYAIVGVLIDAMWVSTYFVINTITPAEQRQTVIPGLTQSAPKFINIVFSGTGGIVGLAGGGANGVGDLIFNIFTSDQVKQATSGTDPCAGDFLCSIGNFISGALDTLLSAVFGFIISFFARIIVFFIFLIALLVQLFKLLFALLKAFISILIDTIIAPLWILAGLLPGVGQSIGFGSWLRDVIANLAVFPAVIFLFLVARIIMDGLSQASVQCATTTTTDGLSSCLTFNPPLIGNASDNTGNFGALIAVGFILAAPGIVESVKKLFKSAGLPGAGGFSTGAAVTGAVAGAFAGRLYRRDPRTGELKGAIGSRVQSFSLGKYSEEKAGFTPTRMRRLVGFATKAPSAKDFESAIDRAKSKTEKKEDGTSGTSGTPPTT